MSATDQPTIASNTPHDESTNALLHRILKAVEQDGRRGRLELVLAIILSLATLASTWCGYQARQWGNLQSNNQSSADTAERKAAEDTIVGLQHRTFEAMELSAYWTALRQKDTATQETLLARMRPGLRKALELSIAEGVLTDNRVPGPFKRAEYTLPEDVNAQTLRQKAVDLVSAAQVAGRAGGDYVLLTLMFASVLFFGGISGTFTARRVRIGLTAAALLLFIAAAAVLITLPVCSS